MCSALFWAIEMKAVYQNYPDPQFFIKAKSGLNIELNYCPWCGGKLK